MKNLRRYTFLAMGLPNLIAFALVSLMGPLVIRGWARKHKPVVLAAADIFCGLATVFAGVVLASLLGLEASLLLPMASAVWFAIHFMSRNRFGEFLRAVMGIACGWWVYEMLPRM